MDTTLTDPLVGRQLDGRYEIELPIARGGMGTVYLATDVRLDRRVAVKVLHREHVQKPDYVARFIREARAAARLTHPDVVAVYDQGTDGDQVFLVMEYVAGATLSQVLAQRGQLSSGEAVAVMDHVLAALSAAHAAGLVHRDIKPDNVLVTTDGRVKVADFGLARAAAGSTITLDDRQLLGTARYLAPEQVSHGTADARSDVYSAGIMFFELLTGTPPYTGDTSMAIAYRHLNEQVPPPSSVVPGIPAELDDLVLAATAREPQLRPPDGQALHRRLEEIRDRLGLHAAPPTPGVDITTNVPRMDTGPGLGATAALPAMDDAPPPPADGRQRRERRRRRWPWVVAFIVLLAGVAAAAGWWLAMGRYTHAPRLLDATRAQAIEKLKDAGLHWKWQPAVYSDTFDAGHVAAETPSPGARVHRGATILLRLSKGPETHAVPDVRNDTVALAKKELERVGLTASAKVKREWDDDVPEGRVIGTDPDKGTELHVGARVTLIVSKGIRPVAVPSVAGMSADDALTKLRAAGFTVTSTEDYSNTVDKGDVIGTSPEAGTLVPPGSAVVLHVSKGPQLFRVPDVVRDHVEDAVQTLEDAGFKTSVHQLSGGPGFVLSQTPSGGSMQPHGTTVTLYVF